MFRSSTRGQILAALASANHGATVRRAALATALALSISSIPTHAAAITVNGSLIDWTPAVVNATFNSASGTDGTNETNEFNQAVENGNGFDIKDVYANYDPLANTLYLGMNFYGTVGNSLARAPTGASPGTAEGVLNAGTGSNRQYAFDQNESYGFAIYSGQNTGTHDTPSGTQYILFSVKGDASATTGATSTDTTVGSIPVGLSVARAVSESANGVEFSITGLPLNYMDWITIQFRAGSGDSNTISGKAEDRYALQMQVVPVPAAAWLLGSGLLGLVAVARKQRKTL